MDIVGSQLLNPLGQPIQQAGQVLGQPQQVATQVVQQPAQQTQTPQAQSASVSGSRTLFTQEQLNSIISSRINPLNQKVSDLTSQLEESQRLATSYLNELVAYRNRDSALAAGIPEQFVDYAVFEAAKLVDDNKDFGTAIKEFAATNQALFGVSTQGVQGSANTTPSVQQPTGNSAIPPQAPLSQANASAGTVAQATQQAKLVQQVQTPQPSSQQTLSQPVLTGATGIQGGNPASFNNIDSAVDSFLKARGLRK